MVTFHYDCDEVQFATKFIILVSDFTNMTVSFRLCLSSSVLVLFGQKPVLGCGALSLFGFVGRGCVCKTDCVYPLNYCRVNAQGLCTE